MTSDGRAAAEPGARPTEGDRRCAAAHLRAGGNHNPARHGHARLGEDRGVGDVAGEGEDQGQTASLFIRPEAIEIGRSPRELPAGEPAWSATVQAVLFDGGNSTVQVQEERTGTPLQIALPLTGRLADLRAGETVHFSYQPSQAWCFAA